MSTTTIDTARAIIASMPKGAHFTVEAHGDDLAVACVEETDVVSMEALYEVCDALKAAGFRAADMDRSESARPAGIEGYWQLWTAPAADAGYLSQSSTIGVEGFQYTAGRPRGWFTGARRGWYVGPVYEVTEVLSERPPLSAVDPEGDATDEEIAALDAAPPTVLDERRSHWSTLEAAEAHAAALRAEGWTATVARIADAMDPTEELAAVARAAGLTA